MLITEYMKKFISISLFISACFLGSCSSYDDERIWQDLNEIEKTIGDYEAQAETLTEQMTSLSKVIGSSFITLGEFYQFNLSSCIRQQNSLTAQFVSFSLANLANIFYPPDFYNN